MARLALAAGDRASFDGDRVLLPVDRRTADAAAKQGGEFALVYEAVPRSVVLFIGRGRIAAVEYGRDKAEVAVRLTGYAPFATPVTGVGEAALPRVRSMLKLDDARYEAILVAASVPLEGTDVQEAQASIETRLSIKRQILRNWGHRCAITGRSGNLDIVAIRPREVGGRLHARNYMPMIPLAARAWEQGVISVGPDGNIVAVENRLDPDLLESMDRSGRLLLPVDPARHPEPEDLAYHFHNIFAAKP